MKVRLTVIKPDGDIDTLDYGEPAEVTLGRSTSCDISVVTDTRISRKHALLVINPPNIAIRDLGSTNGIEVNGVFHAGDDDSDSQSVGLIDLKHGDIVIIGKTTLVVAVGAATAMATGLAAEDTVPMLFDSPFNYPDIPGYVIVKNLGAGGMGSVYLATHGESGAPVAVKTIAATLARDPDTVDTFLREIEVTKAINHPNIVRFLDSGVAPGDVFYLALEYIDGGDLFSFLNRHPERRMKLEAAYPLMLEMADGMAHAHALGIVHRDIKPHNVLLGMDGKSHHAKISDLGLAKYFEDFGFGGGISGGGSMNYMPPEQLTDFSNAKPTADVFGLAATFYEMLTGFVPFNFAKKGDSVTIVSLCDVIPISLRLPYLSDKLKAVFDRALQRDPEDRFSDCGELREALKAADPR